VTSKIDRRAFLTLAIDGALATKLAARASKAVARSDEIQFGKYPLFPTRMLGKFHSRADLLEPGGAISDDTTQADPYYPETKTGLVVNVSTKLLALRPLLNHLPVDVRKTNIRGRYRAIANMLPNSASMSTFEIRLYSSGTPASPPADYHRVNFGYGAGYKHTSASNGASRWQDHACGIDVYHGIGNGADLSAVTHEGWFLQSAGRPVHIGIGPIVAVPQLRKKPAVIFRWDDAVSTCYTIGYPLLDAIGKQGFLAPGAIANSSAGFGAYGRMSKSQAFELHQRGWQIGSQTYDSEGAQPDYNSYKSKEFVPMLEYAALAGWANDSFDGSFFSDVSANNVIAYRAMKDAGMRTIQRFDNGNPQNPPTPHGETFPLSDPGNWHCLNLAQPGGSGENISAFAQYAIDQVVANNGIIVFGMHNDLTNPHVLQAFKDIISRYKRLGDFDIMTPRQLLDPYLALYGADPNWQGA
jgi:hypothetical protein